MPSYLGVSQADLIASINDNLALLETHSPGPACQEMIDALRATDSATGQSKLGAIAAAATDVELATAVRSSGINYVLGRMGEVREFHAYNDTDGTGRAAFISAKAWDGGSGAMLMNYTKVDEECDSWLALSHAAKIEMTDENGAKLNEIARAVSQNEEAIDRALTAMGGIIGGVQGGVDEDTLKSVFLSLDLHERHILNTSFRGLMLENAAPIVAPGALGRYGVVVPELMDKTINWHDPSLRALAGKVGEALSPFYDTDEVQM
ncbi:MAG TPA: hypothetical protein VEF76_14565, partial [Patescibacteria group bacterium]|nr:hypothetical protein [Patescibacteria group bacterium]